MQVVYPRRRPVQMNGLVDDIYNFGKNFLSTELGQNLAQQGIDLATEELKKSIYEVGVYTAYSAPVVYTGGDIARFLPNFKPSTPGAPPETKKKSNFISIAERIKPTIVIDTKFGRKVIAPYGEAKPGEYARNVKKLLWWSAGALALYTVGAYYLGYKSGQRNAGR
jgi:hypothetical protein